MWGITVLWGITSVLWRVFSTVEGIQYCGGYSVLWGITAVHVGDSFSTVGDTFSTVEVVQYSRGITSVQWEILASVLWRVFNT